MNGLELLVTLGLDERLVADPELWLCKTTDEAFQDLLQTPLKNIVAVGAAGSALSNFRLPTIDGQTGILKGSTLLEVVSYRDVSKPLPLAKELELTGEEQQPQYTSTRTFKLLLTDGTEQTFVGMEYESCSALDQIRLGSKVQIKDCSYLHGVLMLTPTSIRFLGAPTLLEQFDSSFSA